MPPPSSRMTKNRAQPTRYRPGKAEEADIESEEESSEEDEEPTQEAKAPQPKASSFPAQKKLAVDLSKAGQQTLIPATPQANKDEDLEGFVTASESSEDENDGEGDSDEEDDESSEEESSSEDEPKKPMLAPKFISKAKRKDQSTNNGLSVEAKAAEEERIRKEKADAMLQVHVERQAAALAAGKKNWDDEDVAPEDEVDDRDGLDPEAEHAAWKLRELKRLRRERLAIEEKEKEREEIERRRNMTAEEREEEDRQYIEAQKDEREEKGKMSYMQKYFHKGAFFSAENEQDEEVRTALNRSFAGAKFEDDTGDKSALPEYMRIRDMTRLGRKGRTKYKDLKNEDTGRWGADVGKKRREYDGPDDRFRPDDDRREGTGANTAPVGERRRRDEDRDAGRDEKRARYD